MILMEILSGPLCRGRFEVPSKYVAISAICLRENRLHLRSGGCNTSRGKHHRGDCLSMARQHKRAIVALCCFHHFDIQKSRGFDPQSQSFPQSYGMLRICFPDFHSKNEEFGPSTTRVTNTFKISQVSSIVTCHADKKQLKNWSMLKLKTSSSWPKPLLATLIDSWKDLSSDPTTCNIYKIW